MSLTEQYFPPLNRYPNTNKGVSMEAQEAWLKRFPQKRAENKPNGGIIQSIPEIASIREQELKGKDLKVMRAKARREYRQALKKLSEQDYQDAKEIKKQLAAWKAEEAKKAKELLDEVSAKVKSYNNIVIDFKYSLHNPKENINQESKGNVALQGNLYNLNFMGVTKIFDGKKVYTIVPEDEEITIANFDANDENAIDA